MTTFLSKRESEVLDAIAAGAVQRRKVISGPQSWYTYVRVDPQPEGHGWTYNRWAHVHKEVNVLAGLGLIDLGDDLAQPEITALGRTRQVLLAQIRWQDERDAWSWDRWAQEIVAWTEQVARSAPFSGRRWYAVKYLAEIEAEARRRRKALERREPT
jgi:hypothetical protein